MLEINLRQEWRAEFGKDAVRLSGEDVYAKVQYSVALPYHAITSITTAVEDGICVASVGVPGRTVILHPLHAGTVRLDGAYSYEISDAHVRDFAAELTRRIMGK